jgi:hypothetical protein
MAIKAGDGHRTMMQGQAGVYTVAAQLILRGYRPMFPAVDLGADIILENGLRLQIKTARLTFPVVGRTPHNNYLGGAYGFGLRRGDWLSGERRWKVRARKGYAEVADFFVLWGIDENRFWVVPTTIKNRVIWFGRVDHPNNSNNKSYTNKRKLDRIAQYENRWDLLDVDQSAKEIVESADAVPEEVKEQP